MAGRFSTHSPIGSRGRPFQPTPRLHPSLIRAARAMLHITQKELAQAASISLATLNNIERQMIKPRSSTLKAINNAFAQAGIGFQSASEDLTLHFSLLSRPGRYDSIPGITMFMQCCSPQALLKPEKFTLFVSKTEKNIFHLNCLIDCGERVVLFDQTSFNTEGPGRIEEMGQVLMAAYSLYTELIYLVPEVQPDTTVMKGNEVIERIERISDRPLPNPFAVLTHVNDWKQRLIPYMRQLDHPLRRLLEMIKGMDETIVTKSDAQSRAFVPPQQTAQPERPASIPATAPQTAQPERPASIPVTAPQTAQPEKPASIPVTAPQTIQPERPASIPATAPQTIQPERPARIPVTAPQTAQPERPASIPATAPQTIQPERPASIPATAPQTIQPERPASIPATAPQTAQPERPASIPATAPQTIQPERPASIPVTAPQTIQPERPASIPATAPQTAQPERPASIPVTAPQTIQPERPASIPVTAPQTAQPERPIRKPSLISALSNQFKVENP